MDGFFSRVPPVIDVGSTEHFIYLALIIGLLAVIVYFRDYIKHRKGVMTAVLITAVIQRVLSNSYYIFSAGYPIDEALPLYICRLVCLFIIIQFFIRNKWLDQVIFYWGLFAYGSFIYPVDISSPVHITGITFVILHGLIIVFPLIRHYTSGFVPGLKGAVISALLFAVYMPLVSAFSNMVGGNYFYTNERPFLHNMGDMNYFLLNLFGVCTAFIIIGLMFSVLSRKLNGRTNSGL